MSDAPIDVGTTQASILPATQKEDIEIQDTTASPALAPTEPSDIELIQTTFAEIDADITTTPLEDEVIPSVTPPTAVENTNQPDVPVVEVSKFAKKYYSIFTNLILFFTVSMA